MLSTALLPQETLGWPRRTKPKVRYRKRICLSNHLPTNLANLQLWDCKMTKKSNAQHSFTQLTGEQPFWGSKEEGLYQFLDVGWIQLCKGNSGETNPHLWASRSGRQHGWKEATGFGVGVDLLWLMVWSWLCWCFCKPLPRYISAFWVFFFLKKILFYSSTMQVYLLRDNVEIINKSNVCKVYGHMACTTQSSGNWQFTLLKCDIIYTAGSG